jgi:hypothetical protein
MTADVLTEDDHTRGCAGREYECTCGYDERVAAEIKRLRAALSSESETAENPIQIIAAAIDPEVYVDSHWTAPDLNAPAITLLAGIRSERQSKAERKATLAYAAMRRAGWDVVRK